MAGGDVADVPGPSCPGRAARLAWAGAASLAALVGAGGCVRGNPPGVGERPSNDDLTYDGGTLHLDDCGYDVTTRLGASPPVMGTPVFGDDPAPRQIHLGIAGDPATSMVVLWRTPDEITLATTVEFGTSRSLGQSAGGVTFAYQAGFGGAEGTVRMHETHLCGLEPDTEYYYRVGGADELGDEAWSDVYHFRTGPSPDRTDAQVTLIDVGDTRDGYDVWGQLMALAADQSPDLILFTGDAVTLGQLQSGWESFFDAARDVLTEVPMIVAEGNHEANAVNYYSLFAMPGDEEDFGFRYGPVHITVANDSPDDRTDLEGKAPAFLDTELAAAEKDPWSIVMHHRPVYSAAANHGGDPQLLSVWAPIFDKHHVDLVLNGHDHDYERSRPMRGNAVQGSPADGTIYVVAGGAGAELYTNGTGPWTELSEKTHNMAVLHVRSGQLVFQAVREDGSQLDRFTLTKP